VKRSPPAFEKINFQKQHIYMAHRCVPLARKWKYFCGDCHQLQMKADCLRMKMVTVTIMARRRIFTTNDTNRHEP